MKKLLLFAALMICSLSEAQVFNNGQTLQPKSFSLGLNPVVFNGDPGMFLYGGYGVSEGFDVEVKYGMLEGYDYFGANMEWALSEKYPFLSVGTGFHTLKYFGLDLTLNTAFEIQGGHSIFTGLDMDFNFKTGNTDTHIWFPVGVEVFLQPKLTFILETNAALSDNTPNTFGGGLVFFF